ncbi:MULTISPECIES: hypothetical protein [Leptolyngbya]|uniref:hypothetical protein n=1 Tax=Leptolyngbya TaxID=47251 RepID=UPI00168404B5|nr:hypothetical protein [Leptolyngbya sp. FACHB-1624]MBD1857434.1 hypothetical protein [Leptolyngbya sp. FACHB-1624]
MFRVGDFVRWRECPSHLSAFARNQIVAVQGDRAQLRMFATFHPMSQMERVKPTDIERLKCESYHLPIN